MIQLVYTIACLLLLLLATSPASAQAPPVKIGTVLPYTGPLSVQGTDTTHGLELYLKRIGARAGGRAIELLKEDIEAKPDVVGPVNSAVALAIRNYVHEQGVPLVVPVAFTRALTAPPLVSPAVFRVIETTDQSNYPMGGWMIKNTKYRKVIAMATDFVAGRHAVEAFMAGFRAAGGQIAKEIYAPLNTPDFAPYLAQVTATPADAVYAFAGADGIRFVKQYKEYGLTERLPLTVYNVLTDDTILPAIGDAALGMVTVGAYSATIDTPEDKAFVREYEQARGAWPSRYSEAGWVSAALITTAIETLKGDLNDRGRVREALRAALPTIKAPRGSLEFDAHRQVISPIYVMRTEKQGNRIVNAIVERIPAVSQEATWTWWNKP